MKNRKFTVALCVILLVALLHDALSAQIDSKPRVYIIEEPAADLFSVADDAPNGRKQVDVVKTFLKRCPSIVIVMRKDMANYMTLLEREGGKEIGRKDNKFVVFDRAGSAIASGSTRTLGSALRGACSAITKDVRKK
jgi:hypothetical protein